MNTMTRQICLQSLRLASVTEALFQTDQAGGCRKIIKRKSEVGILAILFDVDDTLYDASIPFCSACDKVFKEKYSIPSIDLFLAGRIHDIPVVDRIRKAFSKFGIQITESEVMEFTGENRQKLR